MFNLIIPNVIILSIINYSKPMNSHGAFGFHGMPGMPNMANFFNNMPGFQTFSSSHQDESSISINQHNHSLKIREESQSLSVNGHNNKIEITSTV